MFLCVNEPSTGNRIYIHFEQLHHVWVHGGQIEIDDTEFKDLYVLSEDEFTNQVLTQFQAVHNDGWEYMIGDSEPIILALYTIFELYGLGEPDLNNPSKDWGELAGKIQIKMINAEGV